MRFLELFWVLFFSLYFIRKVWHIYEQKRVSWGFTGAAVRTDDPGESCGSCAVLWGLHSVSGPERSKLNRCSGRTGGSQADSPRLWSIQMTVQLFMMSLVILKRATVQMIMRIMGRRAVPERQEALNWIWAHGMGRQSWSPLQR